MIAISLVTLVTILYLSLSAGGNWEDLGLRDAALILLAAGAIIAAVIWALKKVQAITGKK